MRANNAFVFPQLDGPQITWNTYAIHEIDWGCGEVPYDHLKKVITNALQNATYIYVADGSSLYKNNDEIRIAVQHQDLCILPCESSIHITGKFTKDNGSATSNKSLLATMFACFLFEEMRYELNGVEIDRSNNVGITTLMKGFPSFTPEQEYSLKNSGMVLDNKKLCDSNGNFDVIIPLKLLFGFAEDYKQVIVNCKHKLILIRANTDLNAIHQTEIANAAAENVKITLDKIEWLVPYVTMSDSKKLDMLSYISKDPSISIPFRSWELYEYPSLPITTKHICDIHMLT
ncbi:uncharacterized protein [Chelonus insularis]|uniref:uncharacterized protein n=1 Tax=Chelonus insularis TaxID=460826 RepID=UPI001589A88B|nr:uncharacterized protein LOC118072233 [Chelonus insularis]